MEVTDFEVACGTVKSTKTKIREKKGWESFAVDFSNLCTHDVQVCSLRGQETSETSMNLVSEDEGDEDVDGNMVSWSPASNSSTPPPPAPPASAAAGLRRLMIFWRLLILRGY